MMNHRNNTEQVHHAEQETDFSRRGFWVSFCTAVSIALSFLPSEAIAKVNIRNDRNRQTIEIVDDYDRGNVSISIAPLWESGVQVSTDPPSELFLKLKGMKIHLDGVNATIEDSSKFRSYVFEKARMYGFSDSKLDKLKPQAAFGFSTLIVAHQLKFSARLLRDNRSYDKDVEERINKVPIDQLIMQGEEAVCRHFVEGVIATFNVFEDDHRAKFLRRTQLMPIISTDETHGVVAVVQDVSKDVNNQHVTFSFLESLTNLDKGFDPLFFNAYRQQGEGFAPVYDQYLNKIFDYKTQIEILTEFLKAENDKKKKLRKAVNIAFMYLGTIRDLYSNRRTQNAMELYVHYGGFVEKSDEEFGGYITLDEYDLLHSIFLNISRVRAEYEKDQDVKSQILHDGMVRRMRSLKQRYDAFVDSGEIKKAIRSGEDYADLMGMAGDVSGALDFFKKLYTLYQGHKHSIGTYERAFSEGDDGNERIIPILPFENENSLQRYLEYKRKIYGHTQ